MLFSRPCAYMRFCISCAVHTRMKIRESPRQWKLFSLHGTGELVKWQGMILRSIYGFYRDGFRAMTLGRILWCVIGVKLVVIFVVLRIFFFTPHLRGSSQDKARAVSAELTERM